MLFIETLPLTTSVPLLIVVSYFIGSVNPGYLLVRLLRGSDLRNIGSGSLGARNVGRVLGRKGFFLILVIDILKGFLVVWTAREMSLPLYAEVSTAVAVIAGHIWPIWLGFRGGKGIATGLGAFMALDYQIILMGGALVLVIKLATGNFLVAWSVSLIAMPIVLYMLDYSLLIVISLAICAALILISHRKNIERCWRKLLQKE